MPPASATFRSAVLAPTPRCGVWLNLGSPVAAEIAALAGYDWYLIDLEHGSGDYGDLQRQLWALQAGAGSAVVRVAGHDGAEIKRVLDLGPGGLMVPNVANKAEARSVVRAARIPPLGERGAATSTRASRYGYGYERYLAESNRELLLAVQIESREGVAEAAAIAGVEGIDVLFVGPVDLGASLGETAGPRFDEALRQVVAGARAAGKAAGILARNKDQAAAYRKMGFTFLAMGSDRGLLASGLRRNLESMREAVREREEA